MYDKVVVCTDLSDDSDELVGCAGRLGVLGVREAVLTHVVDVFSDPRGASISGAQAENTFERQLSMLEHSGMSVHVEAPMGLPAFSLEEVRRRHSANLIVVGPHGRMSSHAPVGGSTSTDLVQLSESPVLIAALAEGGPTVCEDLLRRVLVCTDFSEGADRAFTHALALAQRGATEFVLLHVRRDEDSESVRSTSVMPDHERREAVEMAMMREKLVAAGATDVEVRVVYGTPAHELSKIASSQEFSLIVMGSRARSRTDDARADGVSERVVSATKTPLLLVPAREGLVGRFR